jgi:hypothetical protein
MDCKDPAAPENVAVTEAAALSVTVHALVPEQTPDQPPKVEPELGVAVRVTFVPEAKVALQLGELQLIPAGVLVTVPVPEPASLTLNWTPVALNAAAAVAALLRTSVHVPEDPEHAPDHPPKETPELGVALRVTVVPLVNVAVQVEPQLMPAGLLVTVPAPVLDTVSCTDPGCGWGCPDPPTPLQPLRTKLRRTNSPNSPSEVFEYTNMAPIRPYDGRSGKPVGWGTGLSWGVGAGNGACGAVLRALSQKNWRLE